MAMLTCPDEQLANLLPWPADDANKYSRGQVVLVAGSAAYPGAACLSATAASRVGAGYVQVMCAPETASVLRVWQPSVVAVPWGAELDLHAKSAVGKPVAYVLGPGFDARDEACVAHAASVLRFVAEVEAQRRADVPPTPLLVDGGALSIVATHDDVLAALRVAGAAGVPVVVTPHGGEAARLATAMGIALPGESADEQADFAQRLAAGLYATVALKGPDTYVTTCPQPNDGEAAKPVYVVSEGTAALAKAGTGDVLAGLIGGLLAQGLAPADAAVLGVTLHARAGRAAAEEKTAIAVTPEDVLAAIPAAIRATAAV